MFKKNIKRGINRKNIKLLTIITNYIYFLTNKKTIFCLFYYVFSVFQHIKFNNNNN